MPAVNRLDIDWEYPGALDRGGTIDDKQNYADFCFEFKAEVARRGGKQYLLTMAVAAGAYGRSGGWMLPALAPLGQSSNKKQWVTQQTNEKN